METKRRPNGNQNDNSLPKGDQPFLMVSRLHLWESWPKQAIFLSVVYLSFNFSANMLLILRSFGGEPPRTNNPYKRIPCLKLSFGL